MTEYTNAQVALLASLEYNKRTTTRSIGGVERDADYFLGWLNRNV